MTKYDVQVQQLEKLIGKLDEVLNMDKTDIVRDSAILRCEMCMDLSWKVVKTILEEKDGIIVASPTKVFREAFKQGYIDNDGDWIEYIKIRNELVHIYKEETAEKVFVLLPEIIDKLKGLLSKLKSLEVNN